MKSLMFLKVRASFWLFTRTNSTSDLKVLTEIDADELNKCLKEFNEEQMSSVDIDGVRVREISWIWARISNHEHRR